MREFSRSDRLSSQFQRELAVLIRDEIRDSRLGMITVQAVCLSKDLSYAKVFFTFMGGRLDVRETSKVLNQTAGFLRRLLSQRIVMRTIPELYFEYDESIERGRRLSALIDRARQEDDAAFSVISNPAGISNE